MKITIKQLKQLIREAAYQGPDAKTVLTVPYSTETAKRDVQVSRIEYEIHPQKRSSGWIYIDLLESGNSDNLNRTQFRDLFSSLGFDRSAFNDIQFSVVTIVPQERFPVPSFWRTVPPPPWMEG
jgi:hypothetical protein